MAIKARVLRSLTDRDCQNVWGIPRAAARIALAIAASHGQLPIYLKAIDCLRRLRRVIVLRGLIIVVKSIITSPVTGEKRRGGAGLCRLLEQQLATSLTAKLTRASTIVSP